MELNCKIEAVVEFGLFISALTWRDWPARTAFAAMHVMALEESQLKGD